MDGKTGRMVVLGLWVALCASEVRGQEAPATNAGAGATQPRPGQVAGDFAGGPRPLFGKITALHEGSLEITKADGGLVVVKLTNQTVYRKDRADAKITDFKVGDAVVVRGDENPDHSVTAKLVGGRSGSRGGAGGGGMMWSAEGTLGKDYVVGEVKAIDPPKLTVLRTDNVTQTVELNEETSLRRGRDSITMADIQAGDHVFARGALENNVFVPKNLNVIPPEMWKRMQEMNAGGGPAAPGTPAPPSPKGPPAPQ